ncbi:hypothetical protein BESB_062580 [Besnoitia besnoiti]|uniref:Glycogen synthase n=1 Tax=Besnoitia besnoiti TaxID=94643 RepID=A0A2A9MGI4_BESBE|nr:hypothetical protein BESB_062580 [Besnoitia besnoiti]PFH35371.1 hypothetical protein BESB_062580 [Besnoitia besnoiti]
MLSPRRGRASPLASASHSRAGERFDSRRADMGKRRIALEMQLPVIFKRPGDTLPSSRALQPNSPFIVPAFRACVFDPVAVADEKGPSPSLRVSAFCLVYVSARLFAVVVCFSASPQCASSSPEFDAALQWKHLREIREELYDIQQKCGVVSWPPPVASDADSSTGDEDGERLGWMVLLLKLHQTFASLLFPPSSPGAAEGARGGKACDAETGSNADTSPRDAESPRFPSDTPSIQTNEFEISSLWQLLQAGPGGGSTANGIGAAATGARGAGAGGTGTIFGGALLPSMSGLLTRQESVAETLGRSTSAGAAPTADASYLSGAGALPRSPSMSSSGEQALGVCDANDGHRLPFDVLFEVRRGCWTSVCRRQQAAQLREHQQHQSQLVSSFLHSRPNSFHSGGNGSTPSTSAGGPGSTFSFSSGSPNAGAGNASAAYDTSGGVVSSGGFGGPVPFIARAPCAFCAASLSPLIRFEEHVDPRAPSQRRLLVVLVIDSEVLHFCCCSGGRFEAYFTALMAHLILAGCEELRKTQAAPAGAPAAPPPPGRKASGAVEAAGHDAAAGPAEGEPSARPESPAAASAGSASSKKKSKKKKKAGASGSPPAHIPADTAASLDAEEKSSGATSCPSPSRASPSWPVAAGAPGSPVACERSSSSLDHSTRVFLSWLKFPNFFPSTDEMVTQRAHHAMRVVLDSSRSGLTPGEAAAGGRGGTIGCWRMTKEKFNWHTTLLTSAAVEAVRDSFADLTLDVWHSCFYGAAAQAAGTKCASRERLEQLLIALLGNNDPLIRLEAVKLLNAFYDRHDWQLRQPFVPLIKNVADRFVLSVLIEVSRPCASAAEEASPPTDVFAILAAPSFNRASSTEIYSYHSFSWTLLQSLPPTAHGAETAPHTGESQAAGPKLVRRQRWLGTADFGLFTRCGFYDWRICKAKESDGSWWVVERAVSYDSHRSAAFPTASAAVLSAPLAVAEALQSPARSPPAQETPEARLQRRAAEGPVGAAAARAAAAALAAAFPMRPRKSPHARTRRFDGQRHLEAGGVGTRAQYPEGERKKLLDECIPLQGRVVVLPKDSRQLQLHEVFVDAHEAQWDEETGKVTQRGNFACVAEALPTLANAGVTATLVTGAMERDCGDMVYDAEGNFDYANPDASPFASVCRASPCALLGGVGGFMEVMQEARRVGMKILVQMSNGVSAAHPHRRYAPHLLHFEDADGKKQILYGGENRGVLPQETAILNHRKLETWQLFVDDVKMWVKKFGIDGVRIANAQELPQMLATDAAALSRKDADGQFHYAAPHIIMGEVVVPHSSSFGGYWSLASLASSGLSPSASFRSAASVLAVPAFLDYANPFYVKLCRSVWLESPEFLFIGECWTELQQLAQLQELQGSGASRGSSFLLPGGSTGLHSAAHDASLATHVTEFSVVPSLLITSGIVPQMQLLPSVLPAVLGKKQPVIPVCPSQRGDEGALRQAQLRTPPLSLPPRSLFSALFAMHHNLPRGAFLLQASCTPASPLPALVYGRAAWAAVDLLMLLPDIPCTFAGEMQGSACRLGVPNFFATDGGNVARLRAAHHAGAGAAGGPGKLHIMQHPGGDLATFFRSYSRIGLGQVGDIGGAGSPYRGPPALQRMRGGGAKPEVIRGGYTRYPAGGAIDAHTTPRSETREGASTPGKPEDRSDGEEAWPPNSTLPVLERVRLLDGFESIRQMPALEQEVQEAVLGSRDDGTEGRFDLKSIHRHYAARRKLRKKEPCLHRGRAILVDVRNPDGHSLTKAHRVYEEWPEAAANCDPSLPAQAAAAAACRRLLHADPAGESSEARYERQHSALAGDLDEEDEADERELLEAEEDALAEHAEGDERVIAFVRFDDERIREQVRQCAQLAAALASSKPLQSDRSEPSRAAAQRDSRYDGWGSAGEERRAGRSGEAPRKIDEEKETCHGHSLVLVVTNLSDKPLHDKSVSLRALGVAFRQHRIKHWRFVLQMCDLLACTCETSLEKFLKAHHHCQPSSFAACASGDAAFSSILPNVVSIEELLSEPFLLPEIPPYSSLLRGFTLLPLSAPSQALAPALGAADASAGRARAAEAVPRMPSLYPSLFCCSLLRLQGLLRRLIHQRPLAALAASVRGAAHGPGVAEGADSLLPLALKRTRSRRALTRGNVILHILRQVAGDPELFLAATQKGDRGSASEAELDLLAEFLQELAFALRYREHFLKEKRARQSLEDDGASGEVHEEERPSASLSLFSICSDSQIFERNEELACTFMARLKRLVAGKSAPPPMQDGGEPAPEEASPAIALATEVLEKNSLGAICFVTPELGRWSTVGGLGVMVDELSTTLATELGQEVWVVSPYYDRNRKGEQNYLARDGIFHAFNVTVNVGGESITLGVHTGSVVPGVKLFFLHCASVFPHIYPDVYGLEQIRFIVTFAKATLEIFCHLRQIPPLVITNDWPTCLIPAYAKRRFFGSVYDSTTFYHIIHNLDSTYEGRIYLNKREDVYWLHGLPTDLLVDPHWHNFVINPSRCVLLQCDGWGTVSPSYRDELMGEHGQTNASPLAPLLRRHHHPFATPNGIPIKLRLERLKNLGFRSHWEAKAALQRHYFKFEKGDDSIPLLAFIGRITQQKGVHLIVELAENLIRRYNGRVQILVGGMANWKDGYAARCANQMLDLRARFPHSFWADPGEFFSNGALVNLGADFGLMPSLFEPGGIVQHEFFIAGTPVIAFRTGGLKDTVREGGMLSGALAGASVSVEAARQNNGFTFDAYTAGDFLFAIERALRLFSDRAKYEQLRLNARASVVSCEESARAWLGEFARLRKKIPVNEKRVQEIFHSLPEWSEASWRQRRAANAREASLFRSSIAAASAPAAAPKPAAGTVIDSLPRGPVPTSPFPPATLLELLQLSERRAFAEGSRERAAHEPDVETAAAPEEGSLAGAAEAAGAGAKRESAGDAREAGGGDRSNAGLQRAHGSALRPQSTLLIPCRIKYTPEPGKPRPRTVAVAGSFDDWHVRRPLVWDNALQAFVISLALRPGKYFYKLVVDGEWVCVADAPKHRDASGNENNLLHVV